MGLRQRIIIIFVSIQIKDIKFNHLPVLAMPREYALLGRNLINLWNLNVNGESKTFTIEPWSTNPDDAYR